MQWSLHNFVHGTTAVLSWHAKMCCDLMASNGITARRSFHRIWIAGKKSLVKRAPDPHNRHKYTNQPFTYYFFRGNKTYINILCHSLAVTMTLVVKIPPQVRQELTYSVYIYIYRYRVNIMGADVPATQGARASATVIFNILNRINSVPAR